jgi:2',3'-cyclic-nucleotide 2'-phosphodiesterase (5'-nucleotidase family)
MTNLFAVFLLLLTQSFSSSINLPFNDINILVVTDVHSWVAGHERHEPQWDANYGHVLSFHEHLSNHVAKDSSKSLFFVMNGDFMDGTGLSTYPPVNLTPIEEAMPFDALNIGNHELYRNSTIEHITAPSGFSDFWQERYITSNVLRAGTKKPLGGSRYKIMDGGSARLLTFGFLYNMGTSASPLVVVEPVEKVVEQEWFINALKNEKYDGLCVLVHMDVQDGLVTVILDKIRSVVGDDVPIQFISGHTHIRAYADLDKRANSFEAGKYLDTVGFVSFNKAADTFNHVFLDANVHNLSTTLGVENLMTDKGRALQESIIKTQQDMGLFLKYGCSPDRYYVDYELSHPKSLWRLYMEKVINSFYFDNSPHFAYIQGNGAFRYDLFPGEVTLDDLKAVNPYNDTIYRVTDNLKGSDLLKVLGGELNSLKVTYPWAPNLPPYICSLKSISQEKVYELFTADFDLSYIVAKVENVTGRTIKPEAQAMGTTQLWQEFVAQEWQKERDCKPKQGLASPELFVGVALLVAVLLLTVVIVMHRRAASIAGYNRGIPDEGPVSNASREEEYDDDLI